VDTGASDGGKLSPHKLTSVSMSRQNNNSPAEADQRFYQLRDAAYANRPVALELIEADPTIVAAKNSIGETALHFLVVENQLEAVEFLARHGSDVDNQNAFGIPAIVEAAQLGYREMVALLLKLGANPAMAALDKMEMSESDRESCRHMMETLRG